MSVVEVTRKLKVVVELVVGKLVLSAKVELHCIKCPQTFPKISAPIPTAA